MRAPAYARRCAGAAAAVVCLSLASPAGADKVLGTEGGTTYVVGKQTLVTDQQATVQAHCPKGRHVWGGGFSSDMGRILASSSKPFDGADEGRKRDDGWEARLTASFPDQARVFAICRKAEPVYTENARTQLGHGGISALCPNGLRVISGGGDAGGGYLTSSFRFHRQISAPPGGNGWRIRTADATGKKVSASAVCGRFRTNTSATATMVGAGIQASYASPCQEGHVVGVSVKVGDGAKGVELLGLSPGLKRRVVPSRAAVTQVSNNGDETRRVNVSATCH